MVFLLLTLLIAPVFQVCAQTPPRGPSLSGVFESSLMTNVNANADNNNRNLTYGLEEYANIRLHSRIGDRATFSGAVNLIAATGDYAARLLFSGVNVDAGEYYAAAIELERLHFKLKGEHIDYDAGLLRIPFGYGQVWKPTDFLNPPNPLKPDARLRAVVGGGLTWYPVEDLKLQGFGVAGRHPLFSENTGLAGISADKHFSKGSAQLLYALEYSDHLIQITSNMPASPNIFTHRAGMSVKADLALGLVMDALYTYNENIENKIDGLSFSAGFDYSLFDARLILLAEYLFNGAASSTSWMGGGNFFNENYLYAGATWRFNDFTNLGLALIAGIDDVSFAPIVTFNHEIAQGVSLFLMAQIPVDRDLLFNDGNRGEFGPLPPERPVGYNLSLESKIKLRF